MLEATPILGHSPIRITLQQVVRQQIRSLAPLGIWASNSIKVYDGTTTVTDGVKPTVTGLQGSDTVTGLTESFTGLNAGMDQTKVNPGFTVNDGNDGSNYTVTLDQGPGFITLATAAVNVTPYSVTYDGNSHAATGTVTGVNGALPRSDLTISSTHTNAGTYADSWSFTDPICSRNRHNDRQYRPGQCNGRGMVRSEYGLRHRCSHPSRERLLARFRLEILTDLDTQPPSRIQYTAAPTILLSAHILSRLD